MCVLYICVFIYHVWACVSPNRFPTWKAATSGDVGMTRYLTSVLLPIFAGIGGMLVAAWIFVRDRRRKKIYVS
jgi:hypothetical protein